MKKKERKVFHGAKELFFRSVTPLIASRDHFVPFILTPRSLTSLCLDESSRPPRQSVFQVHRRELSTADSRHFRGIIFPSIHTLNPRRISLSRRLSIFSPSFPFFFFFFPPPIQRRRDPALCMIPRFSVRFTLSSSHLFTLAHNRHCFATLFNVKDTFKEIGILLCRYWNVTAGYGRLRFRFPRYFV